VACPLRKCTADGTLYTRPAEIEAAIDEALSLDAATRVGRAGLRDRKATGFLRKEVLVHLIRDAKRADDQPTLAKLFTILARRCDAILMSKVPEAYPHAADIRADTLAELSELIATDGTAKDVHKLDFFEVRFERAFLMLRRDVERRYLRRDRHEAVDASLDDPERESIEDAAPVDGEQEPTVVTDEQMRLFNRLPADDRKLLLLRFGNEIKVESTDADEFTLAKHYGVEGRTIRNRLKSALARLAKLERKS